MAKIQVEVYGFRGEGATLKAAREDAQQQAARALHGTYDPFIIEWRGVLGVLTRNPKYGWGYCFVRLSEHNPNGDTVWPCSYEQDRDEAIRRMLCHLAQYAADFFVDEEAPSFLSEKDRREWIGYRDWQRRYRRWRDAGATDEEAREGAFAGRDPITERPAPEVWVCCNCGSASCPPDGSCLASSA